MADKIKRLLFISHESSLSGAPILLLNIVALVRREKWYDYDIVIKRGGPLDERFSTLGNCLILKKAGYQGRRSIFYKIVDYLEYRRQLRKAGKLVQDADLIISNTITNGRLLRLISGHGKPVLTYVHELETVIQIYDRHKDSSLSLSISDLFLSPSGAVAENLCRNHQIPAGRILPLNYYFPDPPDSAVAYRPALSERFNTGWPLGSFVVGAVGSAVLRKGIDLFVQIAAEVIDKDPSVRFIWIGGFLDSETEHQVREQIRLGGLEAFVAIAGFVAPDPFLYADIDVLALPSREDPFPLVVLEAALMKKPAILFAGTGGMEEFVSAGAGFAVEAFSILQFADTILSLKQQSGVRIAAGTAAYRKAMANHSNPGLIRDQLKASVDTAFGLQRHAGDEFNK